MNTIRRHHAIIGFLLLTFVIIVMVGTPSTFLGTTVSFIHADLSEPKKSRTFVRTTMDFSDNQHLQEFPNQIGAWQGADYNVEGLQEQLGADLMLLRAYSRADLYQPLFFLAMRSKSRSSFHPPEVCYPAQGWEITETADDTIEVPNAEWVARPLFRGRGGNPDDITSISVKRLVITRGTGGEINERRVVLYFYVKHATISAAADEVAMIRVEALAPIAGSYEGVLTTEKDLLSDFIPQMFEPREKEDLILVKLLRSGIGGFLGLFFALLTPLNLALYPQLGSLFAGLVASVGHR